MYVSRNQGHRHLRAVTGHTDRSLLRRWPRSWGSTRVPVPVAAMRPDTRAEPVAPLTGIGACAFITSAYTSRSQTCQLHASPAQGAPRQRPCWPRGRRACPLTGGHVEGGPEGPADTAMPRRLLSIAQQLGSIVSTRARGLLPTDVPGPGMAGAVPQLRAARLTLPGALGSRPVALQPGCGRGGGGQTVTPGSLRGKP